MSNFKIKHDKTINDTHTNTLDETHTQIMNTFQLKKLELPSKKCELDSAKQKLSELDSNNSNIAKQKSELKSLIKKLEYDIDEIENDDAEFDYYYKAADTIVEYYELLNIDDSPMMSKNIAEPDKFVSKPLDTLDKLNLLNKKNKTQKKVVKKKKNLNNNNQITIYDYFNIKKDDVDETHKSRASLLDQYMSLINSEYVSNKSKDKTKIKFCKDCNVEKILILSDGIFACQLCGDSDFIIIDSEKPNFKEASTENKSGYPYKRTNHLNEWLSQFQAKESINIPAEVYNNILNELHKNRINDLNKVSISFMKENILKQLGYEIYYEHTVYIMSNLSGTQPPTINRETEEKIRLMFRLTLVPFNKYRPKNRINFLSYSYVLHKIFQLLELDDFLKYFPLLKSREKLILQDETWKKICNDLNWEFYASV